MINVTFYNEKIDPLVPATQKNIFDVLRLNLTQEYKTGNDWKGHAGTIDQWLETVDEHETVCIWDVDCFPYNADIVFEMHSFADAGGIMGVAQKANHIPGSSIYASPACVCFSMKTYIALGRPKFACTDDFDCGGALTHSAREKGVEVRLLYPTRVLEPLWELDGKHMFGKGTTYGKWQIFHAFLSRKDNADMFLAEAVETLNALQNKKFVV